MTIGLLLLGDGVNEMETARYVVAADGASVYDNSPGLSCAVVNDVRFYQQAD